MHRVGKLFRLLLLVMLLGLVLASASVPVAADDDDDTGIGQGGLLAYWPFDEGSGSIAHDVSGNGYDGTIQRAEWTEGVCRNALTFQGSVPELIPYADGSFVDPGFRLQSVADDTEFSVSLWYKSIAEWGQAFASYYTGPGRDLIGVHILPDGIGSVSGRSNVVGMSLRDRNGNQNFVEVVPSTLVNDGEWHHVVFTRSSSSEMNIYFDGVLQQKVLVFDDVLALHAQSADWFLGAANNVFENGVHGSLKGSMDEFRVYDYALSAEDVAALYADPCDQDDSDDAFDGDDDELDDGIADEDDDTGDGED